MSRLDWALWPEARASCIADDEVDCGVPSAPRSGPGYDAWCVSSRDRCSRPVAWHRPPPEPCHGSALSADDRALPGVQPHPKPAPAWSGGAVERLAAYGDTTWPAAHREHDRRLLDQRFRPTPERHSSVLLVDLDVRNRVAQQRSHFFLNFNDQLGVLQFLGQAGNDSLLLAVLLDQWTDRHLGATLLGRESVELALLPLLSPCGQVRRVEALPAQQGTHRACTLGGISLFDDRQLILGAETTTIRTSSYLRIGKLQGGRRRGARCVASFSATLRSCQRSGRSACLACAHQSEISFPALQ